MFIALRIDQFVLVLLGITLQTSASLTITANTLDDGSFEQNSSAHFICINQPYSGNQAWTIGSVSVADCGISLCFENVSNPDRYSFEPNISTGIFYFYIDPVLLSDDSKVIGCYNGSVTTYFTLTVKVSGDEGTSNDGLTTMEIFGIVIGTLIGIAFIIWCCCFFYVCILAYLSIPEKQAPDNSK